MEPLVLSFQTTLNLVESAKNGDVLITFHVAGYRERLRMLVIPNHLCQSGGKSYRTATDTRRDFSKPAQKADENPMCLGFVCAAVEVAANDTARCHAAILAERVLVGDVHFEIIPDRSSSDRKSVPRMAGM